MLTVFFCQHHRIISSKNPSIEVVIMIDIDHLGECSEQNRVANCYITYNRCQPTSMTTKPVNKIARYQTCCHTYYIMQNTDKSPSTCLCWNAYKTFPQFTDICRLHYHQFTLLKGKEKYICKKEMDVILMSYIDYLLL